VVGLTGVAGSGGAISSDDEYRTRAQYDLGYYLGGAPSSSTKLELGGLEMEWTSGRTITLANRGPRADGPDGSLGFDICTGCGWARETVHDEDGDEDQDDRGGHAPRCPGINDASGDVLRSGVWLSAAIRGEALEIELPVAARGAGFLEWRTTLAEALKLGIRDTMQAGNRDIDSFVRQRNGEPWSIVLFDTMPGGTGYLSKLVRDGGAGLKAVAASACSRLESCSCDGSCHRCLREFLNQRVHDKLDRFEVLATLRRLAEGEATESLDPENERLESFLEVEFFKRLQEAALPTPTLQVVRRLGDGRVIRADAVYSDPNIKIFLDGREYHANSIEKIQRDFETRNRLEAAGDLVLEFTFGDVMHRFDEVAKALRNALDGDRLPIEDPGALAGITIESHDGDVASIVIDGHEWIDSESARERSLASCNRLRLGGFRLQRAVKDNSQIA
jgi:hypothetical protein